MLHAGKDAAYIYVFTKVMPALASVTFTMTGNNVTIGKPPKEIVSEAAYVTLALAATQARNNFIDFIVA
jgi:hypothetical protein